MKVDFRAQFNDVAKLLRASAEAPAAPTSGGEFEQLLASLDPEKPLSKGKVKSAEAVFPAGADGPPRARFHPPQPELKLPILEPRNAPAPTQTAVKEAAASVKTPALLAARRLAVPSEEPMAMLAPGKLSEAAPPPVAPSPAVPKGAAEVHQLITKAGNKHGIDPLLGLAIANTESNLNPKAVSTDGHESKGVFQLLDTTGKTLLERAGLEGRYDPFNPALNVDLGVSYIRHLHDIFSRASQLSNGLMTSAAANSSSLEKLAVAAFNAGEGRVASAQRRASQAGKDPGDYEQISPYLPGTTQEYVSRVLATRERFESTAIG